MAYSSTKKKSAGIVQISIGILTVILVVLIIAMMMIVSSIQGTARIVNYAGLVRGKTQRIVKLEISGKQEDDMIQEIESFIDGLMNGNKELNLVRLEDSDFQTKMEELNEYFLMLEQEIMQVRAYGADKTQILSKSEHFFEICDEATGLAEVYSQRKASSLSVLEKYITADIVVLILLIGYEFIKAVRYAAMNRVLQKKVYIDGATGLPNRNKCDELLSQPDAAPEDIGVCSFDLNNLRIINNSMGHEAGDEYIRRLILCGPPTENSAASFAVGLAKIIKPFFKEKKGNGLLNKIAFAGYESGNRWLSKNLENVDQYEADELCGFLFTTNGFINLFQLMVKAFDKKDWKVTNGELPILMIAGQEDPVIQGKDKFEQLKQFLMGVGYKNVSSKLYPTLKHEILNEKENQRIYEDVYSFIKDAKD